MAVIPISQPLAPGLLAADYSPFTPEAQSRSALSGKPGIFSYSKPTGLVGSSPDYSVTYGTGFTSTVAPGGPDTIGTGLPMPDVEGYKYVYPRYTYDAKEGDWKETGWSANRDAYDYYPYWPTDVSTASPILVGVKLIKE